ncbi:MAG: uracil-DNA glycosylase [Patescibacteria group bacterium]|nr:uracil-DNA glycosylase [Patescibacteria group bacterium]
MPEKIKIALEWKKLLEEEFEKSYFQELSMRVRQEYLKGPVFPHPAKVFRAFDLTKPQEVKVVILGQDPYHTPGVADGLAFSTLPKNPVPPSLLNIFKEIEQEFGTRCDRNPDLTHWAAQGVLLLNASLTVQAGLANSHADYGWHLFTDAVISALSEKYEHVVFMLWGAFAGKKEALIDGSKHLVLKSAHPSPLSAQKGFFGNGHFRKANEYLQAHHRSKIHWC